ncbi:MAG: 5'/3'-nucleotidase SurE [Acidimicrobiales bacterium]|nr:5'/3'-nucleotidase SurE [Acidimicrobiales bacterium]
MTPRGRFAPALLVAVLLLVGAGCGDDDASEGGTEPTAELSVEPSPEATVEPTAEPSPESVQPLRILVTNDDGVGAEGIDIVVEALRTLPDVEITVVAPAENQSGTGDTLSDVAPPAEEAATLSGYPATAVSGTPGDSVRHALDVVFAGNPPDLIVSGSNEGQNVGPWAELSGTVGAARIGARAGVPAFAISQAALGVEPDFEAGVPFLLEWITQNREAVLAFEGDLGPVTNLNVASCEGQGEVRGLVEVPLATEFAEGEPLGIDCTSTQENPDDDATALVNGYAALTVLPEDFVRGAA